MRRHTPLTDALIRAALAPDSNLMPPIGILDTISAEVRRTPQGRAGTRWPWASDPGFGPRPLPSVRLAWVVAAAALLLALLAGVLAGTSQLRERSTTRLVPTGIETLTPEGSACDRVVVDGAGTPWVIGNGSVTRFDAKTGNRRTWTVSDDVAFAAGVAAPARAGGLWIWSGVSIRRFTGDGFRESIPLDASGAMDLVETPGGELWAASWDRGLERWDGSTWVEPPAGRPTEKAGALLVLGRDDVWVANRRDPDLTVAGPVVDRLSNLGISHLHEGRWVTYDAGDMARLGGDIGAIVVAGDGSIWVTTDLSTRDESPGIARFDGRTWAVVDGPGFPVWSLEAASDGSVWAVSAVSSTLAVARYAEGRWTAYGVDDGLTGTALGRVSATSVGVFLGTDAGLLRFEEDRWVPVWPGASGPTVGFSFSPRLLAVSVDEAWAGDGRGIWHYVGGAWAGPTQAGSIAGARTTRALALAADGNLWVATDKGVAVLSAGRWTTVLESGAGAWSIAVGPDGTGWAGTPGGRLVGLHPDGRRVGTVFCPNGAMLMTATTDGSIFVGQFSYSGQPGLARFDGQVCEAVDPLGDGEVVEVIDLAADASGGLVAEFFRPTADRPDISTTYVARFDGTRWIVLDERTGVVPGADVTIAPSGEVWRTGVEAGVGIERFDGERWITVVTGVPIDGPISIAPDGAVWFGGPSGIQRMQLDEARP